MNIPEIENVLHRAPKPSPPTGLKQRLAAAVRLPVAGAPAQRPVMAKVPGGWLRRWWPALAPASVSLACAVVLTMQQMEIRDLKDTLNALPTAPAETETDPAAIAERAHKTVSAIAPTASVEQEIARLKEAASRLAAEVAHLEQLRGENAKLRAQLAAPPAMAFTTEETEAMAQAREKVMRIQCVNNLKQFGLAVRMWALDNGNMTPPDIICMSNELSTPKVLFCPADTARQAVSSFSSYTPANCSYEYLAPSSPADTEPNRVLSRCTLHGDTLVIGLLDGSVQQLNTKKHADSFVQRNGKLYFEPKPIPQPGDSSPSNPNP